MAIKDLPQDYQPVRGDWRIQDRQDGTFSNAVFTGSAFVHLEPVQAGQAISAFTEGLTLLGCCDRASYYRAEPEPRWPVQWPWTAPKTESNSAWTPPRFTFGQLVWDRRNPTNAPRVVTGIRMFPAFAVHPNPQSEDEDESGPQTWVYILGGEVTVDVWEDDLLARSDLARVLALLANPPVPVAVGDDFDPFVDLGDLP